MLGLIALFAATVVVGWLALTWYFADEEPLFGKITPARVTFKAVVKGALNDVADITRPAWKWIWLNLPFAATAVTGAVTLMDEGLRTALWTHPVAGPVLGLMLIIARYGSTAAHAPIEQPYAPPNLHGGPDTP